MKKSDKGRQKTNKAREAELYFQHTDSPLSINYANGMRSEIIPKTPALHHRPRVPRKNGKMQHTSDLNSVFDPMKDRHMWTMWRTAVNGRIMDEVRKREKAKTEIPRDVYGNIPHGPITFNVPFPVYGKALSGAPPLSRFIRLDDHSKTVAQSLVKEGQGQLKTSQFIYYGLPRVMVHVDRQTH